MKAVYNIKIIIVLVLSIAAVACNPQENQSQSATDTVQNEAGETVSDELPEAPDFKLTDMHGEDFILSDHYGKVIVLNIWATWCPPCREEIPYFIDLQEEMRDNVLFVGVSVDEEGWEVVEPFAEEFGINYPFVVDNGIVSDKYGSFRGIPAKYFINQEGEVAYMAPGMIPEQMLRAILEELITA